MIRSFNSIMNSLTFPTAITVVDKYPFKDRRQIIINKMMYHPISKIGREYLALDRIIDHKSYTG